MGAEGPQRHRQGHRHQQLGPGRAAHQQYQLERGAGHRLEVAHDVADLGPRLGGGQQAQPGHGQQQPGGHGDQHHDGQDDPDQLGIPAGLGGVASKWRFPQANGSETRASTAMASQLAVAMMAPELSATVAS